jgi:hypothetical protein
MNADWFLLIIPVVCFLLSEDVVNFFPHNEACVQFKPAADVTEVQHGVWVKEKWTHTDQHICSLCHSTVRVHPESVMYRYYPYCGADMRGVEKR